MCAAAATSSGSLVRPDALDGPAEISRARLGDERHRVREFWQACLV